MKNLLDIRVLGTNQFVATVLNLSMVKTYLKGLNPGATDYVWQASKRAEQRLEVDFPFLLISAGLHKLSAQSNSQDVFIAANQVCDQTGVQELSGFIHLQWVSTGVGDWTPLSKKLRDENNTIALSDGYFCISSISVASKFRGQGISKALLGMSADYVMEQHQDWNGKGPALMKISSFETMGQERLLAEINRIARIKEKIIIGFSGRDVYRLGYWAGELNQVVEPSFGMVG